LGLSKFTLKSNKNTSYKAVLSFLYTNYSNLKFLNVKYMNPDEVCGLAISISILNVPKCGLQEDLEEYIRRNLSGFNSNHLIQLVVAAKYFNSLDKNKGKSL
jgi:hypothetical protein